MGSTDSRWRAFVCNRLVVTTGLTTSGRATIVLGRCILRVAEAKFIVLLNALVAHTVGHK